MAPSKSAVSDHEVPIRAFILRDARNGALLRMRVRQECGLTNSEGAFLYILRCADGSYYIGIARTTLEMRIAEHNAVTFGGYTAKRRPVTLVFSQWFERIPMRSRMSVS